MIFIIVTLIYFIYYIHQLVIWGEKRKETCFHQLAAQPELFLFKAAVNCYHYYFFISVVWIEFIICFNI